MPRFKFTFNKWAATYDAEVSKASPTDEWMFGGYDRVLDRVVEYSETEKYDYTSILDIGTGTGNLAARFLKPGRRVYGTDPSRKMRQACSRKYPGIKVIAGDFLKYPRSLPPMDLIVSAYAFHHLTEAEKTRAVVLLKKHLKPGGLVIITDFMYRNTASVDVTAKAIREKWGGDITAAFKSEYPGYYDNLAAAFQKQGFRTDGEQLTVSVWIIRARLLEAFSDV
jgi:putative AdoMet-dependent methyltransferase